MLSLNSNSLATTQNKKIFRNSREDDPDAFISYVQGWATINSCGEEGKVFFLRDHLGGEAAVWADTIPWNVGFEELCYEFLRRFKGCKAGIMHLKSSASCKYVGGAFLAYLDAMKRLAKKTDMPETALIMFVLNGLPVNIASALMMKSERQISWEEIYIVLAKDWIVVQKAMNIPQAPDLPLIIQNPWNFVR
jgi:hypothetical protein